MKGSYMFNDFVKARTYGEYSSDNAGVNALCISIGSMDVYFSYQTVIAFRADGFGFVVSENVFSRTTGKHIGWLPVWKYQQVPRDDFERKYQQALSAEVMPPKDALRKRLVEIASGVDVE